MTGLALQNRVREAFPRELAAIASRSRSKLHDPRAPKCEIRAFEKWERLARGEEAQRVVEDVRARDPKWIRDPRLDQWVEAVYCRGYGAIGVLIASATPLGPLDVFGGSSNIVGYLQGELGITIATGVSAWASQLGGATLDMAQATGAQQPAYTTNDATIWGRSTVTGDGTGDNMLSGWTPPSVGTTPAFIRMVGNRVTDVASAYLYGVVTSRMALVRASATQVQANNATAGPAVTMSVATWYRTENWFNNATTDYLKVGPNSSTGTNTNNGAFASGFRLFSRAVGAGWANLSVQQFLIRNALPSALQLALLDGIDNRFYNGNISL